MMRPFGAVRTFNGVGVGSATTHSAWAVAATNDVANIVAINFLILNSP